MSVMMQLSNVENELQELSKMAFPEKFSIADLPRRIGFDRIKICVSVKEINWDIFDAVLENDDSIKVQECRKKEERLSIIDLMNTNDDKHFYCRISISLDYHRWGVNGTLLLRKCNIKKANKNGEHVGCSDSCLFEIYIPKMKGHECLGNIHNMSYDDEKRHILHTMEIIKRYGIILDSTRALIKEVEINLNFCYNAFMDLCDGFEASIALLKPYFNGASGKKDKDSVYTEASDEKQKTYYVKHKTLDFYGNDFGQPKKVITSFNRKKPSMIIKVYNKSIETKNASNNIITHIAPDITRIEFELTDMNEIPVYFNRKTDFFEMNQADLETAFQKLVRNQIGKPLMQYYDNWNRELEMYFQRIDINEHAWRKNTVLDLDKNLERNDGFLIISEKDLARYVSYIRGKSVSKNRVAITKSLRREFDHHSTRIWITKSFYVQELLDELCNFSGEQKQKIEYWLI